MKKISFVVAILLVIGLASFVYAENSATGMSGNNFREQQVFIEGYNNSGSDISSNYVVVIETTAAKIASGSTLGAYIKTTSTANDPLVLGVTDQVITNGTRGRICVRGPHKVYLTGLAGASIGATLATCTTAGAGDMSGHSYKGGEFGVLLSTTKVGAGVGTGDNVADGFTPGDGTSNYWVWVGKR